MMVREQLEEIEKRSLAPQACLASQTRGRERTEKLHPLRTEFQRDRDRIIHCKSFRRLKHKTQVFLAPYGDHYRTRLTHTLEVSQIARSISKALRLNEDLTEAIALGHDLGHTPFGHSGEKTLSQLLPGGFSHDHQSLRVVEKLEYEGKGLNLTKEVRDGIFKHSKGMGDIFVGNKGVTPLTLEGQVVRVSDVIAYVNHDIDDAVRAGVIREKDIPGRLTKILGDFHGYRIDRMVGDVVDSSLKEDLQRITMSDEIKKAVTELRDFLYTQVYFNPEAKAELGKTGKVLRELFDFLIHHPQDHIKPYPQEDPLTLRVGDFVAGMTDRYALRLYSQIFFPKSWPVL
ncbi:deoxyguanosinetriphosphate triphosphohydrolase [bacterium]|nr:deoxyguanosinetriphosphate triphosphohydrolase [bacterium]